MGHAKKQGIAKGKKDHRTKEIDETRNGSTRLHRLNV